MKWHRAYLALGSNIGDREGYIKKAVELLKAHPQIRVLAVSPLYNTAPVGFIDQPDFLNGAVAVDTVLMPHELLDVCLGIEKRLGRVRTVRWGPRTIDIDLLLYDDLVINDEDLALPHPRMHERAFVLQPLCDIAPDAVHPVYDKTVKQLYEGLNIRKE